MAAYQIGKSVGRGASAYGGNLPRDCETVRTMLLAIPEGNGGSTAIAAGNVELEKAIVKFQTRHFPDKVYGFIVPNGPAWKKMLGLLGEPVAPAAPVAGGGAKSFDLKSGQKFYQWDEKWKKQKLNVSKDENLWGAGCLLTSVATALAWKGITIPLTKYPSKNDPKVLEDVAAKLKEKNAGYTGAATVMTPATLEAFMSLNKGHGYEGPISISFQPSVVAKLTNRKDVAYLGCHLSPKAKYKYLTDPLTADRLRRWIDAEHILIARPTFNTHHWLWITGHDGRDNFTVWDPGYPPGDEDHTASLTADQIDLLQHWGSPASL